MLRRLFTALAALAVVLTGCAESSGGSGDYAEVTGEPPTTVPASAPPATRHQAAACHTPPPSGRVTRSGYGLEYRSGSIHAAVRPDGGEQVCVEFARSGPADPQVPPDTLLFTFAGPKGEGAQVEFETVALTGGRLPPLDNGYVPRVGPLDHPIPARVGISVDGAYYHSGECSLLLTTVTAQGAAGRFDCPRATVRAANPFLPSDDVDYEADDLVEPPPTATLSGWFAVRP